MKATLYAVSRPGLDVKPIETDLGYPRTDEILIKITHCGVGRGDIGFLENTFGISDLKYPLVAGHELVGEVVALGSLVRNLTVGDRVGVGYQIWSCGHCEYCLADQENLCQEQKCLVANAQGGFASHMIVDGRFVFKIPKSIESAEAVPLMCSGLTVYSAIKKADITEGMKVGVIGVGGLGHIAVQLLHHTGAQVTAFSSKNGTELKTLGVDEVLPYESNLAKPKSFDRLFVTTHAPVNYDFYLNLLKPTGDLWIIGSNTEKTTFSSWLLNDFANRSIRGSYIGSPREMQELLDLVAPGAIHGSVKVMPMSQLHEALQTVEAGDNSFRVVVENE